MDALKQQPLYIALAVATGMHLLLFLLVQPVIKNSAQAPIKSPSSHYLFTETASQGENSIDARSIWSPLLFSLPSELGFSHALSHQDIETELKFSNSVQPERFLKNPSQQLTDKNQINSDALLISGTHTSTPRPPLLAEKRDTQPRRIYITPKLQERLKTKLVLPTSLNQPPESAWKVSASLTVTPAGSVEHVFLDSPLESPALNKDVLQLLYRLHFSDANEPAEGRIEISSAVQEAPQ